MKKIFTILFIAFSFVSFAQTYNGDLTITNNLELQAFNYTKVNGVLRITQQFGAPEITSLIALSNLTSVGKLVLDGLNIQDLTGLENLKEVSTYQADSSNFFEIYPTIFIQNCTMTNLNGIGNFNQNNPTVKFKILIQNNNSLQDMTGFFSSLGELNCTYLNIRQNPMLTNIGNSLNTFIIDNLNVESNDNLVDISFVNNATIDVLQVFMNPSLQPSTSIRLNDIREIYLSENNSVENLNLYTNIAPFDKHKRIAITGFHKLKSITGLSSIPSQPTDSFLSTFALSDNDSLRQIEKIGSDSIGIISTSVPNGSNFNSGLLIFRCNSLTNLDFLSNVVEVKLGIGLGIQNNIKLSNCCGIYKLLKNQRANVVSISGNPSACSNQNEIIQSCGPLSISAGRDTTICAGKPVTLTATGATSYSWSSGQTTASIIVSPTTTTSYIVTGTVSGIQQKDTVVVTVKPLPIVQLGEDKFYCGRTSITLTATGNATSWLWNTGETTKSIIKPVSSNNTTIYVTAALNGCSKSDTIKFGNIIPTTNIQPRNSTVCLGDSLFLTATGANKFFWNTGDTINSIKVKPAVTTEYKTIGVNYYEKISGGFYLSALGIFPMSYKLENFTISGTTTIINNNYTTLQELATYLNTIEPAAEWSVSGSNVIANNPSDKHLGMSINIFVPSPPTLYNVGFSYSSSRNAQCTTKDSVLINVNPKKFTTLNVSMNNGQSYTFNGMVLTTNGTYKDTLQTSKGCDSLITLNLTVITAISNSISFVDKIDVFPNPTSDYATIDLKAKKSASFTLELFSIDGKIIYTKTYQNTTTFNDKIDVSNLSTGNYLLRIQSGNEQATYQIIKQ